MQIDKDKLQKILSMSDDELKKKVSDAFNSGNFDKKDKENLDKALKNMKDIKKTIGSIDEAALKNAVNSIGMEKIGELRKNIKG